MPNNDPHALSPPLRDACIAWLEAGGGRFWIVSGVRSYDEQVKLWNAYLNGTGNLAARPGTSKHEKGLAVDIGGDKAFATSIAGQFGLGLTVPGEDWHFEVTNVAVANSYPRKDSFVMDAEAKARFDSLERKVNVLLERTSGHKKLSQRILAAVTRKR